jgi:hypothetical protein
MFSCNLDSNRCAIAGALCLRAQPFAPVAADASSNMGNIASTCCCTRRDSGFGRSASGEFMLDLPLENDGALRLGPHLYEPLTKGSQPEKVSQCS